MDANLALERIMASENDRGHSQGRNLETNREVVLQGVCGDQRVPQLGVHAGCDGHAETSDRAGGVRGLAGGQMDAALLSNAVEDNVPPRGLLDTCSNGINRTKNVVECKEIVTDDWID